MHNVQQDQSNVNASIPLCTSAFVERVATQDQDSGHPIYKHKTFVQVGMTSHLEGKSLDEVCEWLEDEGFPDSVVSTFRGKETCKNMYFAVVNLSCV